MNCFTVQKFRKRFPGANQARIEYESEHSDRDSSAVEASSAGVRSKARGTQNVPWFVKSSQKLRSSHPSFDSRKSRYDFLGTSEAMLALGRRARSTTEAGSAFFNLASSCHPSRNQDSIVEDVLPVVVATGNPVTDDASSNPSILQTLPSPLQAMHLNCKVSESSNAYRLPLPASNTRTFPVLGPNANPDSPAACVQTSMPFPPTSKDVKSALKSLPTCSSPVMFTTALSQLQMGGSPGLTVPSEPKSVPAKTPSSPLPVPTTDLQPLPPPTQGMLSTSKLKFFRYDEIVSACQNFSRDCQLADSDNCFNGTLTCSRQGVVILRSTKQQQELHEWIIKLSTVAQEWQASLHVCQLLGYGESRHAERILVYERLKKGTLFSLLFRAKSIPSLEWTERIKIAYGAARGLASLHEKFPDSVLYDDFRASCVQVDDEYNSKVSLYRVLDPLNFEIQTHSSHPRVTAYSAPETLSKGELTLESNVWSFGVVLLELLSGKQHFDQEIPQVERRNLVKWAEPYLGDEDKLFLVMDPKLRGQFPLRGAKMVARLVLQCLRMDPAKRPTMREVSEVMRDLRSARWSNVRQHMNTQRASPSASPGKHVLRPLPISPRSCGDRATHHEHLARVEI